MGKKNLDSMFQEKFSDFSQIPDERVWRSIEASLDKKKKRRNIIPIWWKLGGAAAVLAIALYFINSFEDPTITIPEVTETEKQESIKNIDIKENTIEQDLKKSTNDIVDTSKEGLLKEKSGSEEVTSISTIEKNKASVQKMGGPIAPATNSTKQQVAGASAGQEPVLKNANGISSAKTAAPIKDPERQLTGLGNEQESKRANENDSAKEVAKEAVSKPSPYVQNTPTIAKKEDGETVPVDQIEGTKKSILDEIAEKEIDKEAVTENKGSKWSAGPMIAPVFFNAIGEGSPVNSIFMSNNKSGDFNLSYGLSVAYELSTKLKLRSGIHKVDYGYHTNDVEFSSSIESAAIGKIANIDYSATAENIIVVSAANRASPSTLENMALAADDFFGQGLSQNGAMTQQFGYLEVPVELEYALLDKKVGVNIIGGISSLFLVDNSISLSSGNLTTELGEANNINTVNFSTNVGVGLNYNFTSKIQLNIEPVFKYQLNTFSQTNGTFQPFTIGVYSGVSFKF